MPQSPEKRRIGIVVDLNEESMYAIKWAVANYIHPEDTVILLYVQPTNVLYGADWGDLVKNVDPEDVRQHTNGQDILSAFTSSELVWPLRDGKIPFKLHVVKDYDRKERICLEAERLKLSALLIGTRRTSGRKRTGFDSMSEYCMNHCECPVVVVRYGSVDGMGGLENQAATLYIDSKI